MRYGNTSENRGFLSNNAYKEARMTQFDGVEVSTGMYNLIIGGVLLWGLLVDFLIAHFLGSAIMQMPTVLMIILYFVFTLGGTFLVYRTHNPVYSFLGFTIMAAGFGIIISSVVGYYTGSSVQMALAATAAVTAIMMVAGMLFPNFFLGLGRILLVSLTGLLIVSLVLALFGIRFGAITYIGLAIFCGYVGYDWAKAQAYPKTLDNAIDSAADIFMDIVNIFIRLLQLMGRSRD